MSLAFYVSYGALWILVILYGVILLGLVRMVSQLKQANSDKDGPRPDREAPKFSAMGLSGERIDSADFAGRSTALLFVSTSCSSCMLTLQEMEALSHKAKGNVIVICRADRDDCARLADSYGRDVPTVVDEDERISRLFDIPGVPTAVLIDERNRIRSYGHPIRGEELEELLAEQVAGVVGVGG